MPVEKKHTTITPVKKAKTVAVTKRKVAAKSSPFSKKVKKINKLLAKATLIVS